MCILTEEMRKEFIAGLRPSYAKMLTTKSIGSVNDIVFGATELYLSGTPFHNRGANRQSRMSNKDDVAVILDPLCVKIHHYFFESPAPSHQDGFDAIHKELCEQFLESFKKAGYTHTYGNAQKFINVLFKYLACYEDAERFFKEKFKYCHMALDRYTYNGYRLPFYRDVVYASMHGRSDEKLTAWSQLTESEYHRVAKDIADYISSHPKTYNEYLKICHSLSVFVSVPLLCEDYALTPFEAEFFLWAIAKRCQEKEENGAYTYTAAFVRNIKSLL